ncbi:hypothetical protein H0Z60_05325 [Ectothiorhodospiraceae bacterium WFHF3C12]|nr:hypothetical protein [Ectothiorhodospiraceae bacterium WFHF3C12]
MPIRQSTMDALVGRIYDAALDYRLWQQVTEEIASRGSSDAPPRTAWPKPWPGAPR